MRAKLFFTVLFFISILLIQLTTKGTISASHTDTIQLVSVASDGTQGNGQSLYPAISGDGHYVAFGSEASNLVTGDTNGWSDVFVRYPSTLQFSVNITTIGNGDVAKDPNQDTYHYGDVVTLTATAADQLTIDTRRLV